MADSAKILVVDDEASLREFLTILLEKEGYTVATAEDVGSGTRNLDDDSFDLVMCDLKLPDGSGLEVLEHARSHNITTPFIIITAHTTPQHALEALRAGAAEYLSKPFNVDDLKLILNKILSRQHLKESTPYEVPEIVASSAAMKNILNMVPRIAATPSTVLITGESGTGKELLARAIHAASAQSGGPFLTVNCGAMPENLLESELFGHVRGSFTGAIRDNPGLFAEASGGTIFLDEIGEMTAPMQVKLLRVLQDGLIRPVGGTKEIAVKVRVLAATNRKLEQDVRNGVFREDLYYRLNVIHIDLPPLRRRLDDIPNLARHFMTRTCARFDMPTKRLTSDAVRILQAYSWPGNVRELENVVERSVVLEPSEIVSSGSLPSHLSGVEDPQHQVGISLGEECIDLEEYLNGVRRSLMRQALTQCDGNQKAAAQLLRLSYRAFRYHAEKLGLAREEDKE